MENQKEDTTEYPFPLNHLHGLMYFLCCRVTHIGIILVSLSYAVWAYVAVYCLIQYNAKYPHDLMRFAYVTLGISALNSCMGVTQIFSENAMTSVKALLEMFEAALTVPCLTTEIWLKYAVAQKEVAWLHTIISLIPIYIFLFQHYTRQDLIDFSVVLSTISLMGVGVLHNDAYATGCAVLSFLTYCVFMLKNEMSMEPASKQIHNYSMALFTYCAFKSVI